MNNANVNNTGKYAVAGGNLEIIHLCEQNQSSFEDAYEAAIKFHRNDIFKYLYENKFEKIKKLEKLSGVCICYHNYENFNFLLEEGMKINNKIINNAARYGNLYLVKYFLKENQIPINILAFSANSNNIELIKYVLEHEGIDVNAEDDNGETALIRASWNGYTEIVKLLLEQKGIDVNAKNDSVDTALEMASLNEHTEIVNLLLE